MEDHKAVDTEKLTISELRNLLISRLKHLPGVDRNVSERLEPGYLTKESQDKIVRSVADLTDMTGKIVQHLHVNGAGHLQAQLYVKGSKKVRFTETFEGLGLDQICGICGGKGKAVLMLGNRMTRCEKHQDITSVSDELTVPSQPNTGQKRYYADFPSRWARVLLRFEDILSREIDEERIGIEPPMKGHYNLVEHLCQKIEEINQGPLPVMTDLKYGRSGDLEMYFDALTDDQSDLVDLATELSNEICGVCGSLKDPQITCCSTTF